MYKTPIKNYTDLFRQSFESTFINRIPLQAVRQRWNSMLSDLELTADGKGWKLVELSKQNESK